MRNSVKSVVSKIGVAYVVSHASQSSLFRQVKLKGSAKKQKKNGSLIPLIPPPLCPSVFLSWNITCSQTILWTSSVSTKLAQFMKDFMLDIGTLFMQGPQDPVMRRVPVITGPQNHIVKQDPPEDPCHWCWELLKSKGLLPILSQME